MFLPDPFATCILTDRTTRYEQPLEEFLDERFGITDEDIDEMCFDYGNAANDDDYQVNRAA